MEQEKHSPLSPAAGGQARVEELGGEGRGGGAYIADTTCHSFGVSLSGAQLSS